MELLLCAFWEAKGWESKQSQRAIPLPCRAQAESSFQGKDIRRKVNQSDLIGNQGSVTQRQDIVLCPYTLFTVGFYEL